MHSLEYSAHDLRKDVTELKSYAEGSGSKPSLDVIKSTIQMKEQVNEQQDRHREPLHNSKRIFNKQDLLLLFLLEENMRCQQYSVASQKDTEASKLLIKILCMLLGIDE